MKTSSECIDFSNTFFFHACNMSQGVEYLSQTAIFTRREIYEALRDAIPTVLPKNTDYASFVRSYVLRRFNVTEDQLTSYQILDLIRAAKNYVDRIRKEWDKHGSKSRFEDRSGDFLNGEVSFNL